MHTPDPGAPPLASTKAMDQAERIRRGMKDLRKAESTSRPRILHGSDRPKKLRSISVNPFRATRNGDEGEAAVWVVLGTWAMIFTIVFAAVLAAIHARL